MSARVAGITTRSARAVGALMLEVCSVSEAGSSLLLQMGLPSVVAFAQHQRVPTRGPCAPRMVYAARPWRDNPLSTESCGSLP